MERFIPNELAIEMMRRYRKRYPDLDTNAVELALRVKRFANLAEAHAEAHFARYGLTAGRFRILIELFDASEGLTPSALAEHGCVSRSTITGLLMNLEKDGLVERAPGRDDGRSFRTRLTHEARRKLERILPDHFRRMSALATVLDEHEQRELVRLLRKVEPALQPLPEPAHHRRGAKRPRPFTAKDPRPLAGKDPRPLASKDPRPLASKDPRPLASKDPRPAAAKTPRSPRRRPASARLKPIR
ncbi:MAG TPA: MarR family transcriptional regulator [Polyangia bacterium]|jgi:DNA-binding MarR family transcriptional regulator|nr:MarR family transcriptional regulator [Polyangia bacterium]